MCCLQPLGRLLTISGAVCNRGQGWAGSVFKRRARELGAGGAATPGHPAGPACGMRVFWGLLHPPNFQGSAGGALCAVAWQAWIPAGGVLVAGRGFSAELLPVCGRGALHRHCSRPRHGQGCAGEVTGLERLWLSLPVLARL